MAKIYLIKFEQNGTTELYRYEVRNLQRFGYDMNTPVSPMPLPEEDASENILIKIEGNSSALDINWTIKDETTDTAPLNTTANSTKSIRDQVFFFEDKFVATSVDDSFALLFDYDGSGNLDSNDNLTYRGTYTQFHVDMVDPKLLTFNARCKFLQGSVALLYEVDVVSEPLNLVVTTPSAGQIDTDWDTPLDAGSSAITDYRIFYRIRGSGDEFAISDVGGTTTSKIDISGAVDLAGIYEVFVRGKSLVGFGRPSTTKIVEVTAV